MTDESALGRAPASEPPYGVRPRHFAPRCPRWVRPLLQVLFVFFPLAAAFSGVLGGGLERVTRAAGAGVRMEVVSPRVLRSGNWFETRVQVSSATELADLTIAFDDELWRAMSIDTLLPDAESAEALDGRFTFHFGPVKSGERFVLKIDGQMQPRWLRMLAGKVTVLDGERPLASAPIQLTVLP